MINNDLFEKLFDIKTNKKFSFSQLGLSSTNEINSLSFLDDQLYLKDILTNSNISGVILSKKYEPLIKDKVCILHEDPRYIYYTLHNHLAKKSKKTETVISKKAVVHPSASISKYNVKIGDETYIGPNVVIESDVEIGNNCKIETGAVIGQDGFEFKRTSKGILEILHDGKVLIGNHVSIGKNSCIDKGFRAKNTIIGNYTKIDNLVHIAHSVEIGNNCFIIAGTVIGGSVKIGDNSWISINSSIAPFVIIGANAFISIGSVVTKNVSDGAHVTGNFAIPHEIFLKNLKKSIKT